MSSNRVQKLLFSEYCDFEDMVLIESPFAQTTKEGDGIRQVHLGITPSKLILATDVLPPVSHNSCIYIPGLDPDIETFELIAIYPVECVNLSVYRRKRRQALKARFCNSRVLYFELGGFEKRNMFWNLWCEKVKFLCPGDSNSSRSETSVATSSTGSSLYLLDKKLVKANGIRQLWCKFGPNLSVDTSLISKVIGNTQTLPKWSDRNLYLGKDFTESPSEYLPLAGPLTKEEFIKPKLSSRKSETSSRVSPKSLMEERNLNIGDSVQINRFGAGIYEGCRTGLYLTVDDYIPPRRYSQCFETVDSINSIEQIVDYYEMAEGAVLMWEFHDFENPKKFKVKHRRRYGFVPISNFEYGLGPWNVSPKYSLQMKRTSSEVNLRSSFQYSTLKIPVSKNELLSTISCPFLSDEKKYQPVNIMGTATKKKEVLFWTTDYWYRPISPRDKYEELTKYMKKLREYQEKNRYAFKRKKYNRKLFRKFYNKEKYSEEDDVEDLQNCKKRKSNCIYNMFSNKIDEVTDMDSRKRPDETSFQHLKRLLGPDVSVCAWDFDSTTLAQQLTMIDKQLFLKITTAELEAMVWQQSSRNAPNVLAVMGFSYRISSLVATEILKDDTERMRARLMARFINVANKCHRISNFQSCKSVLSGLQSPAIYRLKKTWAYVRKKHASKYQLFEFLCRLYRDPRMPSYQKTFFIFSQSPPFLPHIGDVVSRLLNKIPEYQFHKFMRSTSRQLSTASSKSSCTKSCFSSQEEPQINLLAKILKVFSPSCDSRAAGDCKRDSTRRRKKQPFRRKSVKFKGLYEYYKPLTFYEDLREQGLNEAIKFLERCQLGAVHYNFNSNELAQSYLLKARYSDWQENFFKSLIVEAVQNNNVSNKRRNK